MQSNPTTVLNEKYDFWGLNPPTYFQGSRPPNPQDMRPDTQNSDVLQL